MSPEFVANRIEVKALSMLELARRSVHAANLGLAKSLLVTNTLATAVTDTFGAGVAADTDDAFDFGVAGAAAGPVVPAAAAPNCAVGVEYHFAPAPSAKKGRDKEQRRGSAERRTESVRYEHAETE